MLFYFCLLHQYYPWIPIPKYDNMTCSKFEIWKIPQADRCHWVIWSLIPSPYFDTKVQVHALSVHIAMCCHASVGVSHVYSSTDHLLPSWPVSEILLDTAVLFWSQSRSREEMGCLWVVLAFFQFIGEDIGKAFLCLFGDTIARFQICLKDHWSMSEGYTAHPGPWHVKFKRCRLFGGLAWFNLSAQCLL